MRTSLKLAGSGAAPNCIARSSAPAASSAPIVSVHFLQRLQPSVRFSA